MIYGHIDKLPPNLSDKCIIKSSFDWLLENADTFKEGIYDLGLDGWFANIHSYTTIPESKATWESHRRTIDLQYMINGSEKIYFAESVQEKFKTKYFEDIDRQEWKLNFPVESFIILDSRKFVLFDATELHKPMIQHPHRQHILKAVVKIPKRYLKAI